MHYISCGTFVGQKWSEVMDSHVGVVSTAIAELKEIKST